MAANVQIRKRTPETEEDCRKKAEFDSQMMLIRHQVKFTDKAGAEYMFRELMDQVKFLSRRFGLKLG